MTDYEILNGIAINRKNKTKLIHSDTTWVDNLNGLSVSSAIEYLNTLDKNDILQYQCNDDHVTAYTTKVIKLSPVEIKDIDTQSIKRQIKILQNVNDILSKQIYELKSNPEKINLLELNIAKLKFNESEIQKLKVNLD